MGLVEQMTSSFVCVSLLMMMKIRMKMKSRDGTEVMVSCNWSTALTLIRFLSD